MDKQGRPTCFIRRVLRRSRYAIFSHAGCVLHGSTLKGLCHGVRASRPKVYVGYHFNVSKRIGLKGGHGTPIHHVTSSLFRLFLKMRTLLFQPLPCGDSCANRRQVTFCFGTPTGSFNRVPVGMVRLRRQDRISVFLSHERFLVLTSKVRRGTTPFRS